MSQMLPVVYSEVTWGFPRYVFLPIKTTCCLNLVTANIFAKQQEVRHLESK